MKVSDKWAPIVVSIVMLLTVWILIAVHKLLFR